MSDNPIPTVRSFIRASDISYSYSGLRAIGPMSLNLAQGSVLGVIGPSGCGKTTLLYLLGGLLTPKSGKVSVAGKLPTDLLGTGRVGFVFQDPALLPWRSVTENVRLPLELLSREGPDFVPDIKSLLSIVGLSEFAQARPKELSGGMKKRVAFARALVTRPDLMLLDEPFGELDEALRLKLMLELERLWIETPTTAVLVTHNLREAVFLADTVITLSSRPGTIIHVSNISRSRPRGPDFLKSSEFHALYDSLIDVLLAND